jgi:lysophospholipase L1-like esterase
VARSAYGRILISLLAALAAAVTGVAVVRAGQTEAAMPAEPLSVLFVGDSFAAGAGVEPAEAYPMLVARSANWELHVDAQGATGFIENGQGTGNGTTSRLIDRLAEDGRRFPSVDLLIIDAGRNDLLHPTEEIAVAVSQFLTAAQRQWPNAKIVLVLPSYLRSGAYPRYPDLRKNLNVSLRAVNGTLVDPIAEGWYTGADVGSMVNADKVHPNSRGNAFIADQLVASLSNKRIIRVG